MQGPITQATITRAQAAVQAIKAVYEQHQIKILEVTPKRDTDKSVTYTIDIEGPGGQKATVTNTSRRHPKDGFNRAFGHAQAEYRALKEGLKVMGVGIHKPQAKA